MNAHEVVHTEILKSFNVQAGLARMSGNQREYQKLLSRFKSNNADFYQRFEAALEVGETEVVNRLIHTLKGVSGNIGAENVSRLCRCLEGQLKAEPLGILTSSEFSELQLALEQAFSEIDAFLEAAAPDLEEAGEQLSAIQTTESLESLRRLLEQYDSEAEDVLKALKPTLRWMGFAEAVAALEAAIGAYDYDGALEACRSLQNRLNP